MKVNNKEIREYIERWNNDKTIKSHHDEVQETFDKFKDNNNETFVINKISHLECVYHTKVFGRSGLTPKMVAKEIMSIENLSLRLTIGDPTVVNDIVARIGRPSFASKYCHFSNPEAYPINDGNVRAVFVKCFGVKRRTLKGMFAKDYRNVLEYFEKFKKEVYSDSYENLDKYLWIKGGEIIKEEKWTWI